jgi:hypothetical protein
MPSALPKAPPLVNFFGWLDFQTPLNFTRTLQAARSSETLVSATSLHDVTPQENHDLNRTSVPYFSLYKSRDSSVGIVLGYELDDRRSRVRFSAGAGNFSLHHRVQNGSGAHPASYPMGSRGSFSEDKAAGA